MMVRKHWWQSIAAQLWVMVVWSGVILAGLIVVNTHTQSNEERAQVGATLARRGSAQAQFLAKDFGAESDTLKTLGDLAQQPALGQTGAACRATLLPIQRAVESGALAVVDAQGAVTCSAGEPKAARDLAVTPLLASLVRARARGVEGPFTNPATHEPYLAGMVPIPGRRALSLAYVATSQYYFEPVDKDTAFTTVVVDARTQQVLMHYPAVRGAVGRVLSDESFRSAVGTTGVRSVTGLDGVRGLYRSVPVAGTPYQLLVGQSESTAYASVDRSLRRNVVIGLLAVLTLALMGLVLHFRITRPVRRLRAAIRAIGQDPDAGPAPTDGPVELAAVAQAFNDTTVARRRADGLSRAILQHSSDHVLVIGNDHRLSFLAPRARRVLGLHAGQSALSMADRVHPDDRARVVQQATEWVSQGCDDLQTEARVYLADGSLRHLEVHAQDLHDDPYVAGLVLTCRDITDRKEWEQHLAHQARHDPLTGLANRTLVLERLQALLEDPSKQPVAVCFLDLDRFKLINDSHGHAVGDRVLATLARRLLRGVRPTDLVGRFGGDEFVVVGTGVRGKAEALAFAERVRDALREPLRVLRRELFVSGSIGIALGYDGDSAETVLRNADTAMYRGKESGRNSIAFFDELMQADAQRRLRIENDLHRAVEREELALHLQPVVSLDGAPVEDFEALVRWNHPQRGLVAPGEFIPVAEDTGLIVPIGEWVLRQACAWAADAGARHGRPVSVAVNLSPRQLAARHLVAVVDEVLADTGLPASRLCLEVTESVLMEDAEAACRTLTALHDRGVRIAIDDFGTGWASLTYLQQFPVDVIKLDRSFVSRVDDDPAAATIVTSLLRMAHSMGLAVIAEGVETASQEDFLREHGCETAQGFRYGKPVDAAATESVLGRVLAHGRPTLPVQMVRMEV